MGNVSVRLLDQSSITLKGDDFSRIADLLMEAKLTRDKSTQDTLDYSPCGKISINYDDEYVFLILYMGNLLNGCGLHCLKILTKRNMKNL